MLRNRSRIRPHRQISRPASSPLWRLILLILLLLTLTLLAIHIDAHAETSLSADCPPPPEPEAEKTLVAHTTAASSEVPETSPPSAVSDPSDEPCDNQIQTEGTKTSDQPHRLRIWQQLKTDRPDMPDTQKRYVIAEERVVDPLDPLKERLPDYPQFRLRNIRPVIWTQEHGTLIQNVYYDRNIMEIHFIIPPDLSDTGKAETYAYCGLYGSPLAQAGAFWDSRFSWVIGDGDPQTTGLDETRVMQMTAFSGFSFQQGHPLYLEARPHPEHLLKIHHCYLPPEGNQPAHLHTDHLKRNGSHTLVKVMKDRCSGYELTGYQLHPAGSEDPDSLVQKIQFIGRYKVLSFPSAFDAALIYRPVRYSLQLFTDDGTIHAQRYYREPLFCAQASDDLLRIDDYDWYLNPLFDKNSLVKEDALMPDHPVTLFGKRKPSVPDDPLIIPPGTTPEEKPDATPEPEPGSAPDPNPQPEPEPIPEQHPDTNPDTHPDSKVKNEQQPEPEQTPEIAVNPSPEEPPESDPGHLPNPDNTQAENTEDYVLYPDDAAPETADPAVQNCSAISISHADSAFTYEDAPETGDHSRFLFWIASFLMTIGFLIRFLLWPVHKGNTPGITPEGENRPENT